MQELKLSQLTFLDENDSTGQIANFRNSGVLRLRAVAPAGQDGAEPTKGWLDLHIAAKLAWFISDEADKQAEREARGCALPVKVATFFGVVALVGVMIFVDRCDGLFDPNEPACFETSVWSSPLFKFPLIAVAVSLAWALVLFIIHMIGPGGPDSNVVVPYDLWASLVSFDDAIEHAKLGGNAPLPERMIGLGTGVAAAKLGEMISGPMLGQAFKSAADEGTSNDQTRITAAMETIRLQMLQTVLDFCPPR